MPGISVVGRAESPAAFCRRCEILLWGASGQVRRVLRPRDSEWGAVSVSVCSRCGVFLPVEVPADPLSEKISQLARFGLTAGGRPILSDRVEP